MQFCLQPVFARENYPSAIEKSVATALTVNFGKFRCSAVRIAPDLILSAEHCFAGYDGKGQSPRKIYSDIDGVSYDLKVLEKGSFLPEKGRMGDWVLLTPKKGTLPDSVAVADFPDKSEMESLLKNLGDFDGANPGEPIWSVTFPSPFVRHFPRPGFDGSGPFVSKGHLKNDASALTI